MEKRYRFAEIEKEMQALWEREGVYRFDPGDPREIFSVDTPPPTVSGSLHVGHVFSYAQAEMIARHKRLRGYNVYYPMGFDDNGLPTERLVEREKGVRAADVDRESFSAMCTETAERYEREFGQLWRAYGFSYDGALEYGTASPAVQALSQRAFLELARGGKAYMKTSPVLWCTNCRTSIAQAELEFCDRESLFCTLPFRCGDAVLPVATTRPELLYGCVCLFVHPEDPRYAAYVGKTARVPLYGHEIPILVDGDADPEKGTGAVMCATYGDQTDAAWAEKYGFAYRRVLLPDGTLDPDVPHLGGLRAGRARGEIIRILREAGLLLASEPVTHAVGTHERCGYDVEIIPSRQWYIDILSQRECYLRAADEINWYPAHMKERYTAWVQNLRWDWCVSRQRYFGVPIPVWYCEDCGAPALAGEEMLPVNPARTPYSGRCACGCTRFVPETAVLDTWATSSLTPMINARHGAPLPMGMRTQAHEIIRTWAFYSIVRSLYHMGSLPWKDMMVCGFVLAKKGEKISKSKSNAALSPETLVREHSADVIRYHAAGPKLGTDTFFSPEDLSEAKRFVTKLYNAGRFTLSHLADYNPAQSPSALMPADRWLLARTARTVTRAEALFDRYETGLARHEIDDLFWNVYCDNYLELVKERLYEPEKHGAEERRSAQTALYRAFLTLLKLYAPLVPHITEYLYRQYYLKYEKTVSLHITVLPESGPEEEGILEFGDSLLQVIADARREKAGMGASMKAPLEVLRVCAKERDQSWFRETEGDLLACTSAVRIDYKWY